MRLATRFFLATSALVLITVAALTFSADGFLRRQLTAEAEASLEREARLVAIQLPPDSAQWSQAAHRLGGLIGRRVTLIDPTGRVRGDIQTPVLIVNPGGTLDGKSRMAEEKDDPSSTADRRLIEERSQ